MYKWGYELPEFAMFPLFRDPDAVEMVRGIYRRNYDVAARHGMTVLTGGFDYRSSPDWGDKLGYSREGLAETIYQNHDFLTEMAAEYADDADEIFIYACPGPRGEAYGTGHVHAEELGRNLRTVHPNLEADRVHRPPAGGRGSALRNPCHTVNDIWII